MAKPKSPETDEIAVRPPLAVGARIRECAKRDGMGAGPWCVAVIIDALERGTRVETRHAVIRSISPPGGEMTPGPQITTLNEPGPLYSARKLHGQK